MKDCVSSSKVTLRPDSRGLMVPPFLSLRALELEASSTLREILPDSLMDDWGFKLLREFGPTLRDNPRGRGAKKGASPSVGNKYKIHAHSSCYAFICKDKAQLS